MTQVYLGLGGNIGDPRAAMAEALRRLDEKAGITVVSVSSLYRTPPWGKTDQPDFLNAVAEIENSLEPMLLLQTCLAVERSLKRVREERWGPRLIDLDILLYGHRTVREDGLEVPHPRLTKRAFVLEPLAEIARDLTIAGRSIEAWLAEADRTGIERLPGGRDWWKVG